MRFDCGDVAKRSQRNRTRQESTDPGMEGDGRDEVDVLEAAETLAARDVPQAHRLVHRRRQDEVVFRPGHVQQVGRVRRVDAEGPLDEGGARVAGRVAVAAAAAQRRQRRRRQRRRLLGRVLRHQRLLRRRRRRLRVGVAARAHVLHESK